MCVCVYDREGKREKEKDRGNFLVQSRKKTNLKTWMHRNLDVGTMSNHCWTRSVFERIIVLLLDSCGPICR